MNSILSLGLEGLGLIFLALLLLLFPGFRGLFERRAADKTHSSTKTRSAVVDFIRGVSISGIVAIHLSSYYRFFGPQEPFSDWALAVSNLSRFSVPAFLISSGIYLSYSSFSSYTKPKITGLILPYTMVFLIAAGLKYGLPPDSKTWLTSYAQGAIFAPYYFVPLMVQAYVLFPLLRSASNRIPWLALLLETLFLNVVSNHIFEYFDLGIKGWEPILLTHFLFFFTVGVLSSEKFKHPEKFEALLLPKTSDASGFWKFLTFSLTIYSLTVLVLTFRFSMEVSNHLIFYPLGMFLVLFYWGRKIETAAAPPLPYRIFCALGRGSLGIFLLHPVLIHFFHAHNPFEPGWAQIPFYFATWILNLAIPWVVWEALSAALRRILKKGRQP